MSPELRIKIVKTLSSRHGLLAVFYRKRIAAKPDDLLQAEYEEHLAKQRAKLGCLPKLVIALVIVGAIYFAIDFYISNAIGHRMSEDIERNGSAIMLLAHPTATYQGCQFINAKDNGSFSNWVGEFEFDLAYRDNLLTSEIYYLRLSVFVDRGFFVNQQIHHLEFGRDTGYAKPMAAAEAVKMLLSQ